MLAMMAGVVGARAAGAIDDVVKSARTHPQLGNIAGLVGMGITLFSASAVFAQLQGTLNRVWHVKPKPGAAIGAWLRARAHAFALLIGVGFLLITSFVVSAAIQALIPGQDTLWKVTEYIVSVVVFVVAFGGMYKVLPDAAIEWKDAVMGALITTLLFLLGKYAIGFYISHANVGGAYGPAAAFVVLLTWVYYSSIIVLVGAALTRAVAEARGKPILPSDHAVEIETKLAEVSEPGGAPKQEDNGPWQRHR
jgi:membrane protein